MNARLSACRPSTSSRLVENRSMTDAAGARATSTGNSVVSLTNSATWGFQKRMVAYQLPNTVVERSSREAVGCLTRSRNLRVRWTTNTYQNLAFPGRSPREHQPPFGVTMCCGRRWRWTSRRPRRRGANPLCPTSSFVRDSCALAPWLAVPRARRTAAHHTAHAGCDRNTAPLTPEISRPAAHRRFTGTRDQPEEDAMAHPELKALADVLGDLEPTAPTACADWTVHDLVAHLAAGAKEVAELIEEYLAGQPARPTRGFDERERPFRAFTHPGLLAALTEQSRRKIAALEVLAGRGDRAAVAFTGTTMTATQFQTHARSEAALHRWDLVGDDSVCAQLLSQPDLTRHAVNVLNAMPVLDESARIRQSRAPRRIVLTSSGQPDVVIETGTAGARF